MSDPTTAPAPESTPAPTPNDLPQAAAAPVEEAATAPTDAPKGSERRVLADLAKERKARQELEAKVKAFEDAQKSEAERLADEVQRAKSEAATAKAESLRLRVAAETGLPADLHEFLSGDDEEQVRAQAQKLLAATAAATAPRTPAPDPTQGAKPGGTNTQLTRADLARMTPQEIVAAQESGRLADLMAGRI